MLFVLFYLPELKGRSLKELNELFQKRVGVWKFGKYQTEGVGAQIRIIEAKMPISSAKDGDEPRSEKEAADVATKSVDV